MNDENSIKYEDQIHAEYGCLPSPIEIDKVNRNYNPIYDLINEYKDSFQYSQDKFIKVFRKLNFMVKFLPGITVTVLVFLTGASYLFHWEWYLCLLFLFASVAIGFGSYKLDNKGIRLADKLYHTMKTGNIIGLFLSKDEILHTTHKEFKSDQSAELQDVIVEHSLKKIIAEKIVYDMKTRNKKIDENILNTIALLVIFPSVNFNSKDISEKIRDSVDRISMFGECVATNYLNAFSYFITDDWVMLRKYSEKVSERIKLLDIEIYKSLSIFMIENPGNLTTGST
jgi:hypothetical protein